MHADIYPILSGISRYRRDYDQLRAERIHAMQDRMRELEAEVHVLQRVLGIYVEVECDCQRCVACAGREFRRGSLRRFPRG